MHTFQNYFDWFADYALTTSVPDLPHAMPDGSEAGDAGTDPAQQAEDVGSPEAFDWVAWVGEELADLLAPGSPFEPGGVDAVAEQASDPDPAADLQREMIDSDMRTKLMQDILQGSPNPPGFKPF